MKDTKENRATISNLIDELIDSVVDDNTHDNCVQRQIDKLKRAIFSDGYPIHQRSKPMFNQLNQLIQNITDWAHERNLIHGSTPIKQGLKLMSEYGELCDSIAKDDLDGIKDGVGDIAVVAIIINAQQVNPFSIEFFEKTAVIRIDDDALAEFVCGWLCKEMMYIVDGLTHLENVFRALECIASKFGLTLTECLQHAYDEIKDRKGVMYDGVFIKDTDPQYAEIKEQ